MQSKYRFFSEAIFRGRYLANMNFSVDSWWPNERFILDFHSFNALYESQPKKMALE